MYTMPSSCDNAGAAQFGVQAYGGIGQQVSGVGNSIGVAAHAGTYAGGGRGRRRKSCGGKGTKKGGKKYKKGGKKDKKGGKGTRRKSMRGGGCGCAAEPPPAVTGAGATSTGSSGILGSMFSS